MQENIPTDHRRWERQPALISIGLAKDPDSLVVDNSATIIDFSLRGVAVLTTLALFPGDFVRILAKGEVPDAIAARVVWVQEVQTNRSFIAGLVFLGADTLATSV